MATNQMGLLNVGPMPILTPVFEGHANRKNMQFRDDDGVSDNDGVTNTSRLSYATMYNQRKQRLQATAI
jgi:hypothetical protein